MDPGEELLRRKKWAYRDLLRVIRMLENACRDATGRPNLNGFVYIDSKVLNQGAVPGGQPRHMDNGEIGLHGERFRTADEFESKIYYLRTRFHFPPGGLALSALTLKVSKAKYGPNDGWLSSSFRAKGKTLGIRISAVDSYKGAGRYWASDADSLAGSRYLLTIEIRGSGDAEKFLEALHDPRV